MIYCSLGSLSHSSQILKRNNVKTNSYPFDWIFSSPEMIIDCVEDNFNKFLDRQYYVSKSDKQCEHMYYKKSDNCIFRHHNPLIHIRDYEYFSRCVIRFKNLLSEKENVKLFTTIFVNQENDSHQLKQSLIDFNSKFSLYTTNYILLVIIHFPKSKERCYKIEENANVHFLILRTVSNSDGVRFNDETDNIFLDSILKTHKYFAFG